MALSIRRTRYFNGDFDRARSLFPHLNPSIFRQFTLSPVGPKSCFLVEDSKEIGMAFFQEHLFEPENQPYRCVHAIKINPAYQQKGLAKWFIESLSEHQHHINGFVADVSDQKFCSSCGFQQKPSYKLMEMAVGARNSKRKNRNTSNEGTRNRCWFRDLRKEKYCVFDATLGYSTVIADEWNELQAEIDEPLVENWVRLKQGIESTLDLDDRFYGKFLVMEHNDDVIGTAKVFIEPSMDGRFDYMYLRRIRILPQYRGFGLLRLFALSAHQIVSTPRTRVVRSIAGRQVSAFEKAGFVAQDNITYVELVPSFANSD